MIRGLVTTLVARELARDRGQSGGGALVGLIAMRGLGRMGPLGLVLGGAYVAKKAYDRHRAARRAA